MPGSRFREFTDRFAALVGPVDVDASAELALDAVVAAVDVDYRLYRELRSLAPAGPGNPVPILGITGLIPTRVRPAGTGHTQLTLRKGIEVLDGIAFDRADLADAVTEGDRIDVAARARSRTFAGFESLQLEILDVAPGGHLATVDGELQRPDASLSRA